MLSKERRGQKNEDFFFRLDVAVDVVGRYEPTSSPLLY